MIQVPIDLAIENSRSVILAVRPCLREHIACHVHKIRTPTHTIRVRLFPSQSSPVHQVSIFITPHSIHTIIPFAVVTLMTIGE
jgi:hypothetical protein